MNMEFFVRDAEWHADGERLRQVRHEVFVLEQQVPESLEWDGLDGDCRHALAQTRAGEPIATGRLLADGHIGRIAVRAGWRGRGVGAAVFEHLLAVAAREGRHELLLNAQTHALGFYARYGFVAEGAVFSEAGIAHQVMRRTAG